MGPAFDSRLAHGDLSVFLSFFRFVRPPWERPKKTPFDIEHQVIFFHSDWLYTRLKRTIAELLVNIDLP